jgi:DNA repair exonuclease SbcCD ATPase subunit
MEHSREKIMTTNSNRLDIELLKKDVSSINSMHQKMEDAVDRLENAANDITRGLYEQKEHSRHQDRINKEIEDQLEKHIIESQERSKELNKKIECVDEKIEKVNQELTSKIEQSQSAIVKEMLASREELRQEISKINDNFSKKIGEIDTWRYMVMGAIAFIVFFVGNISGISTVLTKLFR